MTISRNSCALSHLILTVNLPGMDIFALFLEFNNLNFPREERIPKQIFLIPKQFYMASSDSVFFNDKYLLSIVYGRPVKERRTTFITMLIHLCQPLSVPRGSHLRVTLLDFLERKTVIFVEPLRKGMVWTEANTEKIH